MTVWDSDTCYCIIEFSNEPHKIIKIIRKCTKHSDKVGDDFISSQSRTFNQTLGVVAQGIIRPIELDEDFVDRDMARKQMSKYKRLMKENPTRTDITNEIKTRNDKIITYFEKIDKNNQDKKEAKEASRV